MRSKNIAIGSCILFFVAFLLGAGLASYYDSSKIWIHAWGARDVNSIVDI